jgi:NADH dehydrogenase
MAPDRTRKRVVVIGGGFGGLYAVRALRNIPVDITLIDRRNFHLFQPLLYQVATASLSPGDIASPLRNVLRRQRNVRVWLGEVTDIDPDAQCVKLADGDTVGYDWLVVATGATHAYFGHPEWEHRAPGLKSVEDAFEIRRRFLAAFEAAEREDDQAVRKQLGTFVIVGAGPTGVELAGAMAEIARKNLPKEFRRIDTRNTRVLLVEGMDRVLPGYPDDLSEKAKRQLEALGVEIRLNTFVTDIGRDSITAGEETIPARNVFWAAGVEASPLGAKLGAPLDKAGRVNVESDLSAPDRREIFVIGDLAHATDEGKQVPGVAQGAMQMGRHAAKMIGADLDGRPRSAFHYTDKGNLATIGRARAVADMGRLKLSGFVAWLLWVFIHILYLIGFRNRLIVMTQWAWAYFTSQRGVRLITGQWHTRTNSGEGDDASSGTAAPGSSRADTADRRAPGATRGAT